ncbi:DUF420 domain-containing protein [Virgibacillus sp. MSJ-26]|uniref:DUF420 domain-containing protein n=1 Tax=Virgibacillus sp. MSJ-26 TaxID=2841522 RepID=UPI001C11BEEF|nr:DUF420 domain-containing protein [Virgibacillus sp. MSJ-26]MBU5466095.1 DUF420 domain-containing protein [Virgibacillus sp. MSJ-26]
MQKENIPNERNYTPIIITLTVVVNVIIAVLFFIPKQDRDIPFDISLLPRLNAILNSFTFIFLIAVLLFILRKNIKMHRNFIFAAFTSTALFLVSYLTYHALAPSTSFGGEGIIKTIYYFILITHISLAPIVVALALFSFVWGLTNQVNKHRKIARWTMPIWLYVSLTGVIVYLMISPYY